MFKFLLQFISRYATPFEKKVEKFLRKLKLDSDILKVQKDLISLMQENLAVLNTYLEWKSRAYKYLKKRKRSKLYENLEILKTNFLHSVKNDTTEFNSAIIEELKSLQSSFPVHKEFEINYLWQIMRYLEPGKRFIYQESTSFGHLLKDPTKEKLIGDCNQIVTLYSYFYSLKYPITDLKIKLVPGHVCLHFEGIDIEATNGHFAKYQEKTEILEISELISTNLLDINDSREKQEELSQKQILKISQLAYKISSKKDLVTKNLKITYKNLSMSCMSANNFSEAVYYARQADDRELLLKVFYNATIYYLNAKNFEQAKYYGRMHGDVELQTTVQLQQAHDFYERNNTKDAINIFRQLGKHEMIKACLEKDYYNLYQKIKDIKTTEEAKQYKYIYKKLLEKAREMQDKEREDWVTGVLGKI